MEHFKAPTASRHDRGFSLVEVLVVIVVLGVLSTVTIFAVRGVTDRGEKSACDTDNRTLVQAADIYLAETASNSVPPLGDLDGDEYERTLVAYGLIREISTMNNVAADGSVSRVSSTCPAPVTT